MTFTLRKYQPSEFDRACDLRGLISEDAREQFKSRLRTPGEWVDHYLHFAIDRDGAVIGDVQLRRCDKTMPPGVVHIGLDVGPQYRNQGAATAALELSWIWAQENSYHRLEGSTDVSNLAMKKAFENANWSFEGIQKKLFFANGIDQDYLAFSRTL